MKFRYFYISLGLAVFAPTLPATDFDSPECRAFIASTGTGAEQFVLKAKTQGFFLPIETEADEVELAKRFGQYSWAREQYYQLKNDLSLLQQLVRARQNIHGIATQTVHTENELTDRAAAQDLTRGVFNRVLSTLPADVRHHFADYAQRYLGTTTPTIDDVLSTLPTARLLLGLSSLRNAFFKLLFQNVPLSQSWQTISTEMVRKFFVAAFSTVMQDGDASARAVTPVDRQHLEGFFARAEAVRTHPAVPKAFCDEVRDHLIFLRTYSLPVDQQFFDLITTLERRYLTP